MKRLVHFVVGVAVIGAVAGCASSLQQKLAQYDIALTATVESLCDLRVAGKIDDDQYRELSPLIEEAYKIREKLVEAAENNDTVSWDFWIDRARDALRRLQEKETAIKGGTKNE